MEPMFPKRKNVILIASVHKHVKNGNLLAELFFESVAENVNMREGQSKETRDIRMCCIRKADGRNHELFPPLIKLS